MMNDDVIAAIRPALEAIRQSGGRPLIVGGAVRDMLLGAVPNDVDIEVYGLAVPALVATLRAAGRVDIVGRAFGVLKVALPGGMDVDISVPRLANRMGAGHRDFSAPFVSLPPEQAALRRDYTINALAYDPATGEIIDVAGGVADLEARRLRHTSEAFAEDALRVLRGMQLAGRYAMHIAPETAALCRALLDQAAALPTERVWEEWRKWAEQSITPSAGLRVLVDTGWVGLYPELEALLNCPQDPFWHPEGGVWPHTLYVCDAAARIATRDELHGSERVVLLLAALCHDLGKPATAVESNGRIRTPGHAEAGVALARAFLARLGCPREIVGQVATLGREHMAHIGMPLEPRPLRRLALRLAPVTIPQWARLVEADHSGRPPLPAGAPAAPIAALAARLAVAEGKPTPILLGRHLLAAGMMPGPALGRVLQAAYEAQINGAFDSVEAGLAWAQAYVKVNPEE